MQTTPDPTQVLVAGAPRPLRKKSQKEIMLTLVCLMLATLLTLAAVLAVASADAWWEALFRFVNE